MPNYCTGHIRLPNGCSQNVTIVLHGDIGDEDTGNGLDGFVPTRKAISLHLGSGSRSWRGGRVDEMDDQGHPTEEDVMLSTTDGVLIAAQYGEKDCSNVGNVLVGLVVPKLATDSTKPSARQQLLSSWPLSLLPHDWRHWCIRHLTIALHRLVKFSIRAILVTVVVLFLFPALLTFWQHHHSFSDFFSSSRGGAGVGRDEDRNELQEHVPVFLLPFELPNHLNETIHNYGSIVLDGTNWLIREAAPIVGEVVKRCGCNHPPKDNYQQRQYSSKLCQALCSSGGPDHFIQFPGAGRLLALQKSLHGIKAGRNFWLEDLSPRWLDMAHAQDRELQRVYRYTDITDSLSKGHNSQLRISTSSTTNRQTPYATTLVTSTSLSYSSYEGDSESNSATETHISESELQSRLRDLLQLLHHLQPDTHAYADNHAKARSIFETTIAPRNDRLQHAYDRAVLGFLPDINLIDMTWKGAIATFVQWEEWFDELGKVLTAVRRAAMSFNRRPLDESSSESQIGKSYGKKEDISDKEEAQLALHVQTMCSQALGHVRDVRSAASSLVQQMEMLHRIAKTYSASGWRIRRTVAELEHDGMVSAKDLVDMLESVSEASASSKGPGERKESDNENDSDGNKEKEWEARVKEQAIEAWVVWPVGEDVRQDIEKAANLLSLRKE
ncbi:hypothetical protein F4809DRAFT_209378 [Biscogniauxia mediterranea]|nr:hypothetical protein F4809DRAFT_209378 [Biscogniauxia mediterranea]